MPFPTLAGGTRVIVIREHDEPHGGIVRYNHDGATYTVKLDSGDTVEIRGGMLRLEAGLVVTK